MSSARSGEIFFFYSVSREINHENLGFVPSQVIKGSRRVERGMVEPLTP